MRLRLWRRRLTISAPRVLVRSAIPWPLRWLLVAVVLGASAALALWAFEFGRDLAGLDRHTREELRQLQGERQQLLSALAQAQAVANTAENLLTAERAAQQQLALRLRELEDANRTLRRDLAFFEQLMPVANKASVSIRGLQARRTDAQTVSWRLLAVQPDRNAKEFRAELDMQWTGTRNGQPWSAKDPRSGKTVAVGQSLRLEGESAVPTDALVNTLTVRMLQSGAAVLSQSVPVISSP